MIVMKLSLLTNCFPSVVAEHSSVIMCVLVCLEHNTRSGSTAEAVSKCKHTDSVRRTRSLSSVPTLENLVGELLLLFNYIRVWIWVTSEINQLQSSLYNQFKIYFWWGLNNYVFIKTISLKQFMESNLHEKNTDN